MDQSISEKQLHADLPKLLKQSIQMEQKYDIDFVMQDAGELAGDCLNGAERIKTIVHEMRYFAHPEKQSIEPYNLAVILNKVVSQFATRLPPGVAIDNTVDDLPETECNGPHIEQAFTKLIQNAVDAIGKNGQIVIEGRVAGDWVEIKIRDNGRGIAPEHLSKVFDPFFTTKDVGQGVGLGLTTALNIIKMHNGSIHAVSKPGEATSFKVCLPLAATAPQDR